HPPLSGLIVSIGKRDLFLPIERVESIEPGRVTLSGATLDLGRFERRAGELLLGRDLSARHLINLVGARLVRANEIELACIDGAWQVVAVDPSSRPLLRHLLPSAIADSVRPGRMIDWASIEPFVAHVPSARLRIPYRKLSRLRPAQIADLVEAASHEEGEEIIAAVGQDRELEADVFEELDPEHQREFLASRPDAEAARLLARMAPDDVADLIADLDQERRLPLLEALPAKQRSKVRTLLSYNPETAGGLMSPDFLALPASTPVEDTLEAVRQADVAPEALGTVYSLGEDGTLAGSAALVRLLKARPGAQLGQVAEADPVTVRVDADQHAIVRKMSDFNLSTLPVVDRDDHLVGVVTVDDVLELLLPTGWRRDFGMTAADA
ncbi:MAG TPA: CBS domain-containing protein, partial [Acidimicrobiales bacterium]|nr:CBS domain-containing protein [Acidimicrobiales bacterium]